MKRCARCKQDRPITEFGKSPRYRDGLFCYCRHCDRERAAARRAAAPERVKAIDRKSIEKHRDAINARKRARRAADPEATRAQRKADYAKYREKELATMRKWKAANRERMRNVAQARYWSDPIAARAAMRAYREANPAKARVWRMTRIATQLQATPVWADLDEIRLAYEAADLLEQVTGEFHEVDHVVPLRGAIGRKQVVCGLHIGRNLQVIPRADNRRKSNVVWPDMPHNLI